MARLAVLLITLVTGYALATVAFAGETTTRQSEPLCPPLCPITTTTTEPPPPSTTNEPPPPSTPPAEPPPDSNAPTVSDKPTEPAKTQADGTRVSRMSNERTYTTWATYRKAARVFSRPFGKGRRVARLHRLTIDRLPEVYVILRQARRGTATPWLQIRVPVRPNGTVGWVRRDALARSAA